MLFQMMQAGHQLFSYVENGSQNSEMTLQIAISPVLHLGFKKLHCFQQVIFVTNQVHFLLLRFNIESCAMFFNKLFWHKSNQVHFQNPMLMFPPLLSSPFYNLFHIFRRQLTLYWVLFVTIEFLKIFGILIPITKRIIVF